KTSASDLAAPLSAGCATTSRTRFPSSHTSLSPCRPRKNCSPVRAPMGASEKNERAHFHDAHLRKSTDSFGYDPTRLERTSVHRHEVNVARKTDPPPDAPPDLERQRARSRATRSPRAQQARQARAHRRVGARPVQKAGLLEHHCPTDCQRG